MRNKESVQLCIFDLDGVITDTAKYHYAAWRSISKELGYELTESANEKLKGVSRYQSLQQILIWAERSLSKEATEHLLDKKNKTYLNLIESLCPQDVLPGVKFFVEHLKENGIFVTIGSASKNANNILEKLNMMDDFDLVVDGHMVKHSKPNPEVFLLSCQAFDVAARHTVVFEDSYKGIGAARTAKMHVIGIGNPANLPEDVVVWESFEAKTIDDMIEGIKYS